MRLLAIALLTLGLSAPLAAQELKPVTDAKDRAKAESLLKQGIALDVERRELEAALVHKRALLDAAAVAFIETQRLKLHAAQTDQWDWTLYAFKPAPPAPKPEPPKEPSK